MGTFPVNLCAHITNDEAPAAKGGISKPVVTMPLRLMQDYARPMVSEINPEDIILIRRLPPVIPSSRVKRTPQAAWKDLLSRRFQHIPEMQSTLNLIAKNLENANKNYGAKAESTIRAQILLTDPVTQIVGRNQQWLVSEPAPEVAKKTGAFAVNLCGFMVETADHRVVSCDGAPLFNKKAEQAWARFNGLANPAIFPIDKEGESAASYRTALLEHTPGLERRVREGGQSIRHVLSYTGAIVAISNTPASLGNNIGRMVMGCGG